MLYQLVEMLQEVGTGSVYKDAEVNLTTRLRDEVTNIRQCCKAQLFYIMSEYDNMDLLQ